MKQLKIRAMHYVNETGKKGNIFRDEEFGITVYDVTLDLFIGQEITIGHVSDIHYNFRNQEGLNENDPVQISTLKNCLWLTAAGW